MENVSGQFDAPYLSPEQEKALAAGRKPPVLWSGAVQEAHRALSGSAVSRRDIGPIYPGPKSKSDTRQTVWTQSSEGLWFAARSVLNNANVEVMYDEADYELVASENKNDLGVAVCRIVLYPVKAKKILEYDTSYLKLDGDFNPDRDAEVIKMFNLIADHQIS
jgi:hypothetical protein